MSGVTMHVQNAGLPLEDRSMSQHQFPPIEYPPIEYPPIDDDYDRPYQPAYHPQVVFRSAEPLVFDPSEPSALGQPSGQPPGQPVARPQQPPARHARRMSRWLIGAGALVAV